MEASEEGIVSSKVGGKVVRILFEEGKYIHQGEPLVELDEKEARNNLRAAESQLSAAQASLTSGEVNLDSEQRNFERLKVLFDNNGIAKVELENAEIALKLAKANLEAQKAKDLESIALKYPEVRSMYTTVGMDQVAIFVKLSDKKERKDSARDIAEKMRKVGKPKIQLDVDRDLAADLGVSPSAVGETLNTLFDGVVVSKFNGAKDRYDVRVSLKDDQREDLGSLSGIYVSGSNDHMAAQFESYIDPIAIMFALPLAIIGAILGLFIAGSQQSVMSLIGVILLMGLVAKNAILLVDYARQRRNEGVEINKALVEAGLVRLRPIVMTSLAMIFGMLPSAFAQATGSEMYAPMAHAVIGGLITSTILTLFVVPVIYTLLDDCKKMFKRESSVIAVKG